MGCFGGHEAPECEVGDRQNFRTCMSNPKCHWGPTQIKRCRTDNDSYRAAQHPALAQNGMERKWAETIRSLFDSNGNLTPSGIQKINQFYKEHVMGMFDANGNFEGTGFEDNTCKCYGGDACEKALGESRMNIDTCLRTPGCHWGPGENQTCAKEQAHWNRYSSALAQDYEF